MYFTHGKERKAALRVVGFLILFAFLSLPFHSHALTESPRIAKECSCIQGTRTSAALIVEGADWAPLTEVGAFEISSPRVRSYAHAGSLSIRAPPLL